MKKYLFIALLFISKVCFAQTGDINERPAFNLKLLINDSTFYESPMKASLFVIENKIIQIFPGEEIFIESEVVKDSLMNLKRVPAIINEGRTLRISFLQSVEGNVHKQMILKIVNPFSKQLDYKAQIYLESQKRWEETSVIGVLPKLVSYEMWPYLIPTLTLSNFRLKN